MTDKITLNNVPIFSENVIGQYTASAPLANGTTQTFSFTSLTYSASEQVTQNLANYTGTGNFTINVDASLQSVNVTGGSFDQNKSTFPISGTIIVSYNQPYTPVPEPRN